MNCRLISLSLISIGTMVVTLPAFAGQVYGTIVGENGPVQNATVSIVCAGVPAAERSTDGNGSYSVYVAASGNCEIRVNGIGPLTVRVYDDEVRYDLRVSGTTLAHK